MDGWTYQGIELWPGEAELALFKRVALLSTALGRSVGLRAIGTFLAPTAGRNPPRYNPNGEPRRFLHLGWERESEFAWASIAHVGQRDGRALLSSFNGAGFRSRDLDVDGHPRESVLLAAFTGNALDLPEPISFGEPDVETLRRAWLESLGEAAVRLAAAGMPADRIAQAAALAQAGHVRFEFGWYFDRGQWRSRYLVRTPGSALAIAVAQESICTCASRRPETLQLMMPSDNCLHHVAAALVDRVAGSVLADAVRSARAESSARHG
ncbi:MAG: hypothetical protein HY331_10170 [Chloroflexi bacterium]|nr:hypothetical protein [Chloroflexota bacterium]